jgi:hypothetical protein
MSQSDALLSLSNSKRAIWASIAGGTLVFAGKLCVVMYCGGMGEASDSVVAETAHSFVDVLNQVFLLVGIQRSQRPVSDLHPRGTSRDPSQLHLPVLLWVWACRSVGRSVGRSAGLAACRAGCLTCRSFFSQPPSLPVTDVVLFECISLLWLFPFLWLCL